MAAAAAEEEEEEEEGARWVPLRGGTRRTSASLPQPLFPSGIRGAAANNTVLASAPPSLFSLQPPSPKARGSLASWEPCSGARPHGHRLAAAARG